MIDINGYSFTYHPRAAAPEIHEEGIYLWHVYDRYSPRKEMAYDYCRKMCIDLDGFNFAITSHSPFTFCVMFNFVHPETGELMRAHITPRYNHLYHVRRHTNA